MYSFKDDSESNKLGQQLNFLREIDKLKRVLRQSPLLDQSRKENSAEHSWHLAMYALILSEHAAAQGDELSALWHEFEEGQSDDAQFAKALDRFQPLLINVFTGGGTWVAGHFDQSPTR